jgi:hypothetical protein
MKKIIKRFRFPVHFLLLLLASNIQAQTWIMLDANNSVTYIGDGWVKSVEVGEEGDLTFIYNASQNTIILIDDANGMYAKGSGEDYCNSMKSLQNEMNNQLPPEQKKAMQDMINELKAKPTPKVAVAKGAGEVIAGYQTTKYSINVDGELFEEKWITNDAALHSIISVIKNTYELTSKTAACSLPDGWPINNSPEFTDAYRQVENSGIELRSIMYEYGDAQTQTDVVSLEKEDVPESAFEAPADYENVGFKELLMSMSGM